MGYKEGKREVTSQVRAVPLGQKRKRGRPKGLGNCLLRSPPQSRVSPPTSRISPSTLTQSMKSPPTSSRSPSTLPQSRVKTPPPMPKVTTRRGRKRKQTKTPTKSPSSSGTTSKGPPTYLPAMRNSRQRKASPIVSTKVKSPVKPKPVLRSRKK